MRVAIATQDLARVDAHLGWARHLMVYEVSAEGCRHVRTASFHSGLSQDGDHGKLVPRLKALSGCSLVFVADVGPDGEHALARKKVVPMRQFAGQPVAAVLDALQYNLRRNTNPWLRGEEIRCRRGS
ncbi:MAG TPA: NifB/NifX family molybdenum-iron cluster-binding protein [Magnetospirillum sp.]|nr:NifB/NifX family molybdenum-iron cluster-binding protein [Magnetospirillum sp.]